MSNQEIYNQLFDVYLQYGWDTLSKHYNNNLPIKNIEESPEIILFILGKMRKEHVDKLFNDAKKHTNSKEVFLQSFGSTNIKSDYDLTLVGKDAPTILKYMWKNFYNSVCKKINFKGNCKKSCKKNSCLNPHIIMPISMDTNMYLSGYYSASNELLINKNIRKLSGFWIHNNGESGYDFGFSPATPVAKNIGYSFALLKLAKAGTLKHTSKNIISLTQHFSKNLQNFTNAKDDIDNIVNFYKNLGGYEMLDSDLFDIRYNQMYNSAKTLYNILYNNVNFNEEDFYRKMSRLNAYSIESAYTSSSVNIVVLELQRFNKCTQTRNSLIQYPNGNQLGKGIKCKPAITKWPELVWRPMFLRDDYLLSALENIAEFKTHYKPLKLTNKVNGYINYISNLKYILRVAFSIARYNNYNTGIYKNDKYALLYKMCGVIITFKEYTVDDFDNKTLTELNSYFKAIKNAFKLKKLLHIEELSEEIIKDINELCIAAEYKFDGKGLEIKSIIKKTLKANNNQRWSKAKTQKNKRKGNPQKKTKNKNKK
tara:strand:+ start:496 stop:2109 length:1614 start_codon:yes stop_codon:yes gene_type:complete